MKKGTPVGLFIQCDFCNSKSLLCVEDRRYEVKVSFVSSDNKLTLAFPHDLVAKFAEIAGVDLSKSDELEYLFLTVKNIEVKYSELTHVITEVYKIG